MADVKISQLPVATTPLAGTEEVPLVQSGTTKKVTVANLRGTAAVTAVTGTAPVVSSGGTTPAISMAAANTSTNGYLTSTDWNTFNGKGSGTVTGVTATSPVVSSGGTAPVISLPAASTSANGYLTSTDWNTFNNKQPAGSYLTSGGALGTPSSGTATNLTGLPLTTGVTGLLPVANGGTGTATPALVAGTNVTITGTWPNQTVNATGGGGGTVTSVAATVPSFLSVTGSPITTTGTLAIAYSGTALPVANGGTAATTAAGARSSILPSYAGNAGKVLAVNTGATDVEYISVGGTGTVTSVGGTGTVNGISLSGTVTAAGNLTLGGTLDLSSPPAIGGTTAAAITGTTVTASTKFSGSNYDASGSGGGALRTSGGSNCLQWGGGGGVNLTLDGAFNMNPANATIQISPTGTGTLTVNPATAGTINNMAIGGTTPAAGAFTTVTASTAIGVASGGTGATSLTANNVILGNGTSAVQVVAPGTNGNVLTSNGTTWVSSVASSGGLSYTYTTTAVTATNNQGILADTSGGSFTVTLPATPSVGNQVIIADAGSFWGTNNLTVGRNGSTIGGLAENLVCDLSGVSVQFVYDGTTWEVYAQVGGQGGNAVTLDGVQTLTNKTLTVPKITSAALSTATAGALEYDGKVSYFTPQGLERGVTPGMQYYRLNSALTGANSTAAQSFMGVGVTLSSSTVYAFEGYFPLSKSTGTTAHIFSLLFGGTATINNIGYSVLSASGNSTSFISNAGMGISITYMQVATAMAITGSTFTVNPMVVHAKISGTVSINAGGTFIPQYQLSAAPGGAWTVASGAYFSIYPISASGSNTSVGTWA